MQKLYEIKKLEFLISINWLQTWCCSVTWYASVQVFSHFVSVSARVLVNVHLSDLEGTTNI